MKTLSGVANSYAANLCRAADVVLKEGRKLIIFQEKPLHLGI
ncbi:MAG: hypothetical protein Ct9H90mP13_12330 [Pseudomonadota bacterium]|nr:MAG: hypothetical protein Ct9H90mP13_12330 [Pseudomonadota bacterium]